MEHIRFLKGIQAYFSKLTFHSNKDLLSILPIGAGQPCLHIRVTLISKILEFQKAGSTTSRYIFMDHKTGFRFPLSQK